MSFGRLFQSIRPIKRGTIVGDATAGIELAAMSMPQSLGYASIAGMPAVTGLYTLLLPFIGFAAFGSSCSLVVAADSATAAILAGGLSPMATTGSTRYIALAGLVALMTAVLLLIARLLKLGFLADFLSQTVLVGFLTGVGFQVGIAVLGKMLGIPVSSHRTLGQLAEVAGNLNRTYLPSLALSLIIVGGILVLSRFAHRVPAPLVAVVGSIAASAFLDFARHGIAIIGPVANGLPHFGMPDVAWKDVEDLLPIATSCFVMILTQSAATARIYALRHHQQLNENDDLIGLAAANGLAAFSGTFVVNGSPTQTAVAESAGSKSQIAQISAAIVVTTVLLFVSPLLQYLPQCVLGSIVFVVAIHLIDFKALGNIRRESPAEFALAAVTAVVVVTVGVEPGIVLAMVMSLLRIVRHSYQPHTAVLIKGEGDVWQSTAAVPGTISQPGLVIYHFGAPLFYANASRFTEEIRNLVDGSTNLRWVLVDAGAITRLDFSAAQAILELQSELAQRHIQLVLAHVEPELQADLDRHHLTEVIGRQYIFDKLHNALAAYQRIRS